MCLPTPPSWFSGFHFLKPLNGHNCTSLGCLGSLGRLTLPFKGIYELTIALKENTDQVIHLENAAKPAIPLGK